MYTEPLTVLTVSAGTLYSGTTNLYEIFATTGATSLPLYEVGFGNGSSIISSPNLQFSSSSATLTIGGTPIWNPSFFKLNVSNGGAAFGKSSYVYNTTDAGRFFYNIVRDSTEGSNFGNPIGNGAVEFAAGNTDGIIFGTLNAKPIVFGTNGAGRLLIDGDGQVSTNSFSAATILRVFQDKDPIHSDRSRRGTR